MNRSQSERLGAQFMQMALDNLMRDGYAAFATLLISGESCTPVMLEQVNAEQKEPLGEFLRVLARSEAVDGIVIIREAWTLQPGTAHLPLTRPVSEHPDRKEGVFVQVSSNEGDLLFTTTFDRYKNGDPIRPIEVSQQWQPPTAQRVGNFSNLYM